MLGCCCGLICERGSNCRKVGIFPFLTLPNWQLLLVEQLVSGRGQLLEFEVFQSFFASNWALAVAVAGAFAVVTKTAHALLPSGKKDSLALWLMGAETDQSWSRSFCDLFDEIFGAQHLSLKCILRSFLASLLAMVFIWVFLGSIGTLQVRAAGAADILLVLKYGLAINLVADYVSLLETRYLLKLLDKHHAW